MSQFNIALIWLVMKMWSFGASLRSSTNIALAVNKLKSFLGRGKFGFVKIHSLMEYNLSDAGAVTTSFVL
jgi:hypothetical protein